MRQVSALVAAGLVFLELSMAIIVAPISPSGPKAIHVEPSSQVQIPSAPIENSPSPSAEVLLWTRQFGSSAFDSGVAVASDPSGVYVAGATGGTLAGETNSGGIDAFLKKSDASGMELWTRQFGSSADDEARGVAAAGSGVYVAGITAGVLAGQTSAGAADAFVRKYDPAGNEVWTRQFGTSVGDFAFAVAADESGIYVAGYTEGVFPNQTSPGGADAFVRRYDANGTELWTRQIGSSDEDIAWAVAVNTSSVYLAGSTQGTLPGQTTGGGYDAFVLMYNMSGGVQWIRQFGTPSFDIAYGVAAEASAVYVVGYTTGMLPGQPSGGYDAYIRKYDAAGTEEWTRQSGTSGYDEAHAVAVNGTRVYVAGYTGDAFVRVYEASGNLSWTRDFGTAGFDAAYGITGGPRGLYVAGRTDDTFPGETSAGGPDAFLSGFGQAIPPRSPTNLRADPGDATVALAWDPPSFDGGFPITNYTIYRGTSSTSLTRLRLVGNVLAYADTAVTNGLTYYYQVSAVTSVGEGPRSNEFSVTPARPPSAPLSLALDGGNGRITLNWQAPASDGGAAITNYRIYRGTSSSALFPIIAVSGNVRTYSDSGLVNGVRYFYQVSAANAAGEGPQSTELSATPVGPDTTRPNVAIASPLNGAILRSASVTVTGTAADETAVARVELSLDGRIWSVATGTTSWSADLTLREGSNTIVARATDTSGNLAFVTITVTLDLSPPVFLLGAIGIGVIILGVVAAALVRWRRRTRSDSEGRV